MQNFTHKPLLTLHMARSVVSMDTKQGHSEVKWHLAQFKPNCAQIAKRNLSRQGFEVFLPLEKQTRIARSKFMEEIKAFFPGYLFVGTTIESGHAHSIRSTYGISQLVQTGTKAAIVPVQIVEELKSRCNSDGVIGQEMAFEKGDNVRVTNGPFADLIGEVERTTADRRVWLLLDVMGKKTKVLVAQAGLQAKESKT